MSKFDRVLGDGDVFDLLATGNSVFVGGSDGCLYFDEDSQIGIEDKAISLVKNIEQAVLAKLAEQAINEIVGFVDPMPDEKALDQHYAEFCDHWDEISKKGVDGGWRSIAWEAWKRARGINDM